MRQLKAQRQADADRISQQRQRDWNDYYHNRAVAQQQAPWERERAEQRESELEQQQAEHQRQAAEQLQAQKLARTPIGKAFWNGVAEGLQRGDVARLGRLQNEPVISPVVKAMGLADDIPQLPLCDPCEKLHSAELTTAMEAVAEAQDGLALEMAKQNLNDVITRIDHLKEKSEAYGRT